jgi:hypothetical protein
MPANPLVRQLGLADLLQREAQEAPPITDISSSQQVESALAGHIRHSWTQNKLAKYKIERRMLNCLRARRGEYSQQALAQIQANGGTNVVWADLTETKCRGASAWIREIVLPAGERPWGLQPTPLPDLPRALKLSIVDKAIQEAQQVMQQMAESSGVVMEKSQFRGTVTELGTKLRKQAERELKKAAEQRALRMEDRIADNQAQGGWEAAIDAFIEDFVTYPAAILKGPIYQRHKRLSWGDGWKPLVSNNPAQTWERVCPFDIYPTMGATDCQEGDLIERIRFRRQQLYDLKGLPGYHDDQIDAALRDYSNGHLEGWLWTESERQRLEQETLYLFLTPPGLIDALNYWGSVPGWKLLSWGVQEDLEPERDYEVNCLLIGRYVVYCALNPDPLGARPYHKACYDEIPGAFWGRSIPDLVATHQQMMNAIACALADNLGAASGPMGWIHMDRLAEGEQSIDIGAWKMWQLRSDPSQGVNPGIGFFQPQDNSASLMKTYAEWELRADDACGVPRYTYGNGTQIGAGDTATGLAMLMNNAAKGLRRAIANIDMRVIQPTITQAFTYEMLYNPDESIKGDCVIVPRGANAILIKETAQTRRTQFLGIVTSNPLLAQILGEDGIANLLREVATAMELPVDEIVPDEEELQKRRAEAAEAQQAQMQAAAEAEQAKAQAEVEGKIAETQAKGQIEQQSRMQDIIGDIVKQAVTQAVATERAKAPKKIVHRKGEDGLIETSEVAE